MRVVISLLVLVILVLGMGFMTIRFWGPSIRAVTVNKPVENVAKVIPKKVVETISVEPIPEFEVHREQQINEVVALWGMFLDDGGANPGDSRRGSFEEYAGYLADVVSTYQESPTDIGGQIPKHENAYLLIATRITKESSIRPDVVGLKGEVGLLQVMPGGPVMAGYSAKQVRHSPRLGLVLGVRWLAYATTQCGSKQDLFNLGWTDYDWLGPLSFYAGGMKARRKNGTCASFDAAKKIVARTLLYRSRINRMDRYGG